MKPQKSVAFHFISFIVFSIKFFELVEKFIKEDILRFMAAGLYSVIAGIWGSVAGMVLLKIPSGPQKI